MAFGLIPQHKRDLPFSELTHEEFLVLALATVEKLNWTSSYISRKGIIAYTDNGAFSWNAEIKIILQNDTAHLKSASIGSDLIDLGRNKKNIENFIRTFETLKQELGKEELSSRFSEISVNFQTEEDDDVALPDETTKGLIGGFFSIFIPRKGFFITPLLLDINILLFILMSISGVNILLPDNESLLKWGANFKPMTLDNQWWRLITNCFLHIGFVHLLLNMYALLFIGVLLEPLLGRTRFVTAYFLSGLVASLASLWWNDLIISAGASGAIFGMYGVFLALLTTDLIEKTARKALLTSIAIFVGYNLFLGLKGGIDNAAHIGGLLAGIAIGYSYLRSLKNEDDLNLKITSIGLVLISVLFLSFLVLKNTTNDIGKYDEKMKTFFTNEAMALEVYNLPDNTPVDKILYGLHERGIYYWEANIKLIDDLEKLDLPEAVRERDRLLKQYCELRIKSYELISKAVSEDTDIYRNQIEANDKKIESVLTSLQELNK